jgi:membrane protein implicated in regulation of membrane protease activity
LLVVAEMMAPGVFLLWIGLAALATGLILFVAPLSMAWTLMVFAALSVISLLIGRKVYGARELNGETDRPFLNRRAEALIGKSFTLDQPIKAGEGRVRVNDSIWRVRGPDMPAGYKVRVTGLEEGVVLRVEQA